jgi:hypothetical protein
MTTYFEFFLYDLTQVLPTTTYCEYFLYDLLQVLPTTTYRKYFLYYDYFESFLLHLFKVSRPP